MDLVQSISGAKVFSRQETLPLAGRELNGVILKPRYRDYTREPLEDKRYQQTTQVITNFTQIAMAEELLVSWYIILAPFKAMFSSIERFRI